MTIRITTDILGTPAPTFRDHEELSAHVRAACVQSYYPHYRALAVDRCVEQGTPEPVEGADYQTLDQYVTSTLALVMGCAVEDAPVSTLDAVLAGHEVSPKRLESLQMAHALGAPTRVLETLRDAHLLARRAEIALPANRLEGLSRGRGWCRKGRGGAVVWAERVTHGYAAGPGRWTVGATDGFSRKASTVWDVTHVQVGCETWTIAN